MKCIAYIEGPSLCRNGFPQNAACRGSTCHGCGRHTDDIAPCIREDLPALWLNDDGSPRHAAMMAKLAKGAAP